MRAVLTERQKFYACRGADKGCKSPTGPLTVPREKSVKAHLDETIERLAERIQRGDA